MYFTVTSHLKSPIFNCSPVKRLSLNQTKTEIIIIRPKGKQKLNPIKQSKYLGINTLSKILRIQQTIMMII